MDVLLTPELEASILARVHSGRYPSTNDVLLAAVRALEREEQAQEHAVTTMRAELERRWQALESGTAKTFAAEELFAAIAQGLADADARRTHTPAEVTASLVARRMPVRS